MHPSAPVTDMFAIAHEYFEASNNRDFVKISELLHENATYQSDNVGLFYSRERILEMIRTFFAGFTSLLWNIENMQEKSGIIEIICILTGVTLSGEGMTRKCLEHLVIFDGKIQHISVKNLVT